MTEPKTRGHFRDGGVRRGLKKNLPSCGQAVPPPVFQRGNLHEEPEMLVQCPLTDATMGDEVNDRESPPLVLAHVVDSSPKVARDRLRAWQLLTIARIRCRHPAATPNFAPCAPRDAGTSYATAHP
jgi:hypothetical protein